MHERRAHSRDTADRRHELVGRATLPRQILGGWLAFQNDHERRRIAPVPDDWEDRARQAFLDGYLSRVETNLLPPGDAAIKSVLGIYELEKAVYELRYELDNRPDWVTIPVAGIERILGEEIT